jgi:integrase
LELKGVTKSHLKQVEIYLRNYKKYILSVIDKEKSLEYFKELQRNNSAAYYKRQMFQLRRFLKFMKIDWAVELTLPADPYYTPIHISKKKINDTINYFTSDDNYLRIKAVILLGCSSGLRPNEIYNLTENDIDLNQRKIIVRHDPNSITKTTSSLPSFFREQRKKE